MTLQEAIKSGKMFKRKVNTTAYFGAYIERQLKPSVNKFGETEAKFICDQWKIPNCPLIMFTADDVMAEDWEVVE